jgi:prophage maintenance system killer protein
MWRPRIEDYVAAAAVVLNTRPAEVREEPRLPLAESALAAPFAGLGDADVFHSVEEKAAVLVERLVENHPLEEGNERAAFLLMLAFLERNERAWGEPDPGADATMVERLAAGDATRADLVDWITARTAA